MSANDDDDNRYDVGQQPQETITLKRLPSPKEIQDDDEQPVLKEDKASKQAVLIRDIYTPQTPPSNEQDKPDLTDAKLDKFLHKYNQLEFRDYQRRVIKYMYNHKRILVVHGTGSGKTLTAIGACEMYLSGNQNRKVMFVSYPILIDNFKKGLRQFGITNEQYIDQRYFFYSYDRFVSRYKFLDMSNTMLIVDEAHGIRNQTNRGRVVALLSYQASKVMLLTATPFINRLTDYVGYMNIVTGYDKYGYSKHPILSRVPNVIYITEKYTNNNIGFILGALQGKTDYFNDKTDENYPTRINHFVKIQMTPKYYEQYGKVTNSQKVLDTFYEAPSAFINGYRRAVNSIASNDTSKSYYSQKLKSVIGLVKKSDKTLIYSNWIESGINSLEAILQKYKLEFASITGETNQSTRTKYIQEFNEDKFNVLLISQVGGHGIDLKGVRTVIILDPPWSDAVLEQIIGRAVRYRSHSHLPIEERKVEVYYLALVPPVNELGKSDEDDSGDVKLYKLIIEKFKINKQSDSVLKLLRV